MLPVFKVFYVAHSTFRVSKHSRKLGGFVWDCRLGIHIGLSPVGSLSACVVGRADEAVHRIVDYMYRRRGQNRQFTTPPDIETFVRSHKFTGLARLGKVVSQSVQMLPHFTQGVKRVIFPPHVSDKRPRWSACLRGYRIKATHRWGETGWATNRS